MTAKDSLRDAMKAGQLRSEDIASKAGISQATVYAILNGRTASRLVITALKQIPEFAERYDGAAVA